MFWKLVQIVEIVEIVIMGTRFGAHMEIVEMGQMDEIGKIDDMCKMVAMGKFVDKGKIVGIGGNGGSGLNVDGACVLTHPLNALIGHMMQRGCSPVSPDHVAPMGTFFVVAQLPIQALSEKSYWQARGKTHNGKPAKQGNNSGLAFIYLRRTTN